MTDSAHNSEEAEDSGTRAPLELSGSRIWLVALSLVAAIFTFSVVIVVFEHELRAANFGILLASTIAGTLALWVGLIRQFQMGRRLALQSLLVLMIVVAAMFSFIFTDIVQEQSGRSYLAVLIISFIGAATVILPAPAALTTISFAGALDQPILVGLVAALGQVAGETVSYYIGSTGKQLIHRGSAYARTRRVLEERSKLAGAAIFVFAAVPNPAFDAVGILAGALRYSFWRFLLLAYLGNAFKYIIVFAVIGVRILDAIPRL